MIAVPAQVGTVARMDIIASDRATWLNSVDDVDELYSDLLGMPPKIIVTPDGVVWEIWVDSDDLDKESLMQLHQLGGEDGCRQLETASFEAALHLLADGFVLNPIIEEVVG